MDSLLIEGARELFATELFKTACSCNTDEEKAYLQKHINIASEYFTNSQKLELKKHGYIVR